MNIFNRIIKRYKSLISSFVFRVISSVVGVLLSVIIAHTQPKNVIGDFFIILSLSNLMSNLICYGTAPFINKHIARKGNCIKLLNKLIPVYLFSSICCVIVTKFLVFFYDIKNVIPFILSSMLISLQSLFCEVLKGLGDYRYSQLLSGPLSNLLFIFALIFFYYQNPNGFYNVGAIYFVWLVCLAISTFILILFLISKLSHLDFVSLGDVDVKFSDFTFIFFSSVIVFSMSQLDLWIIAKKFSPEVLAEYGLSVRLALAFSFSVISVRVVAASKIPKLYGHDNVLLQEEISRSCLFSLVLTTIGVLVVYFFGDIIITFMYGKEYQQLKNILLILSVGQLANSLTGPCDYLLSHCGYQSILFKLTLSIFIIEVILFFIVINYSVSIYVYASVVSSVIVLQNLFVAYVAYKKTNIISLPLVVR